MNLKISCSTELIRKASGRQQRRILSVHYTALLQLLASLAPVVPMPLDDPPVGVHDGPERAAEVDQARQDAGGRQAPAQVGVRLLGQVRLGGIEEKKGRDKKVLIIILCHTLPFYCGLSCVFSHLLY